MDRESEGKSSGIPHLAKHERDVGHPSFVREREADPAEFSIDLGIAWQTGSGRSRAIIPLKPKYGLNGAPVLREGTRGRPLRGWDLESTWARLPAGPFERHV